MNSGIEKFHYPKKILSKHFAISYSDTIPWIKTNKKSHPGPEETKEMWELIQFGLFFAA